MFSLQQQEVKLGNCNPRCELHGEDHVLAADLSIEVMLSNDVLSEFDPQLKGALYWKGNDDQGELIDEPGHLPSLRFPEMSPFKWAKDLAGYDATIHIGFSGSSDIKLTDCAIDKFVFTPEEGGTVRVNFRIQCHPNKVQCGELCELQQQHIDITLTPPELRNEEPDLVDGELEAA